VKIVLILPHDTTYRHKTGSFRRQLRYPPLTLTILAGLVPPEINADVRIIDEGVEKLPTDLSADLVGITALTATAPRAYSLADRFRSEGTPVVLGGVHPTVLPDEAEKHADAVVIGFGEETWPELLRDFKRGEMKSRYRSDGLSNLAGLPFPRRDLLRQKSYLTLNTIIATRGCPNSCRFCSIPTARQGHYYCRPVADVTREIQHMNGRRFIFLDPNLTGDAEYARRLYRAVIPLNIRWVGLTTTKMMENKELVELAARSGCFGLLLGFESVSQEALCQAGKGFNHVRQYRDIVTRLHDHGISVLGCFMLGFDTDDPSVFERTLEFIEQSRIDLVRYTVFTPFPGTGVYENLLQQDRIVDNEWSHYDYEHVVFRPSLMSIDQLQEGMEWIWKETYRMGSITRRMMHTPLRRWENLIYNFGFRHHAMAVGKTKNIRRKDYEPE
jgi:radical SAM superfamily enzyme YgiQ (UPF0313 family)